MARHNHKYFVGIVPLVVFRLFTKLEITGQENIKSVKNPYIIVSNHESHLDPELVASSLYASNKKLFPISFVTKDSFFKIPVFAQIIIALGAFPAHKKEGIEKSLAIPTQIINDGGGVIMFPEGRIISERPLLGEGRRGAAILGHTTDATIIPMSLHTPANLSVFKFVFTQPKIVVRIGKPFKLTPIKFNNMSDDQIAKSTKDIMTKIGELYFQHKY